MRPVLGVGWDVGGWHGTKQAVAVALFEEEDLRWPGKPSLFSIPQLHRAGGSAIDLIRLGWPDVPDDVLTRYRVAIAIDAPLGFPELFARILASDAAPRIESGSFYENPLAYRETDRWVYRNLGKAPLSASFDRLGNNAVTAIIHARRWSQEQGFRIAPQHGPGSANRTIIEVYPALVKRPDSVDRRCYKRFGQLLPEGLVPGTDQYDAAICAVLAASYGAEDGNGRRRLPTLIEPPEDISRSTLEAEGWIYPVPIEWLLSEGGRPS